MTRAPLAARPRTTARPMPLLPPVTTAVRPARSMSMMCLQSAVSLEIVDASCPHRSGGAVPPVPGFPPSSDNGDEEPVSHPLLPLMAGQTNWQRFDSPAVPAPNTSRALRAAPARRSGAIAEVEHATRGLLKLAMGGTAV